MDSSPPSSLSPPSTSISTSTPPPYTRSSSRLADLAKPSPSPIRLKELLLLSPSPNRKPRLSRQFMAADDSANEAPAAVVTPGRRGKSRAAAVVMVSPRNTRRARRRLEREIIKEDREILDEEGGKVRRKRQSRSSKASNKEKLSLVPFVPDSNPRVPVENNDNRLEGLWEQLVQLVMWKNVAKSTLWFGFGSMFILSSCFSREINFSFVSAICQLCLLILGIAFVRDTIPPKEKLPKGRNFQITEDNIICVAQAILPIVNTILAKMQEILCGEPLMTLKVAPVLLLGAKYGHLVTCWRLFAAEHVQLKVESIKDQATEAWETCHHKKLLVVVVATLLWNLFSAKTRIFAGFISVVILRYHHQGASEEKVLSNDGKEEHPTTVLEEDSGDA